MKKIRKQAELNEDQIGVAYDFHSQLKKQLDTKYRLYKPATV